MWFTLRDGLLGKVHQDLRKFSAIHCKANRHIIWRIYFDSPSVGFTLFKISLSICAIHSSGSEAWMSTPVGEVGLAYDWRGARAESLHTTETTFFVEGQAHQGSQAEHLTSLQIFSSNELGGFVARRNAFGKWLCCGCLGVRPPAEWVAAEREPAQRRESLTRRVLIERAEARGKRYGSFLNDIDASTTTHVCTRISAGSWPRADQERAF